MATSTAQFFETSWNIAVFICAIFLQIWPKTEIRLHFGRGRISKMAFFLPELEPKSCTALNQCFTSCCVHLTTQPLWPIGIVVLT